MGTFIKAGNITEFSEGTKKKVTVNKQEIMLVRVGTNYYAIANRCPHMGGDLSMGTLEGTIITCPRHGSKFDVKDGKVIKWTNWPEPVKAVAEIFRSERPVKTYKTKVENGEVSVEV
jgi:3-phenylpropionate/trans-cinnamate dioxygenase ferredoxin component